MEGSHVHYSTGRMCKLCMCPSKGLFVIYLGYLSACVCRVFVMCFGCVNDYETCWLVIVQTGTRAPGLKLSSPGMCLNHMTPSLPPSGPPLHHTSPWSRSVTAMAPRWKVTLYLKAQTWRKPRKLFHQQAQSSWNKTLFSQASSGGLVRGKHCWKCTKLSLNV